MSPRYHRACAMNWAERPRRAPRSGHGKRERERERGRQRGGGAAERESLSVSAGRSLCCCSRGDESPCLGRLSLCSAVPANAPSLSSSADRAVRPIRHSGTCSLFIYLLIYYKVVWLLDRHFVLDSNIGLRLAISSTDRVEKLKETSYCVHVCIWCMPSTNSPRSTKVLYSDWGVQNPTVHVHMMAFTHIIRV